MQDINKEIERERNDNRKHKGFVSRFEHTCSTFPPSTHEGFHYARSQWISPLCRNTYKPSDSLVSYTCKPTGSPRPHLEQQVRTRTRNNADTHVRLLKKQEKISW